jgi:hypothetical protein
MKSDILIYLSVGRVVSIMTKNNTAGQQVVRYFTDDAFALTTYPDACGSFERLHEDKSILAQNCQKWGKDADGRPNKWGFLTWNRKIRISTYPFFIEEAPQHGFRFRGIFLCDDSLDAPSPCSTEDTWKISVR